MNFIRFYNNNNNNNSDNDYKNDNNNDNNVWNGYSRFIAGFNDWRALAVGGCADGSTLT